MLHLSYALILTNPLSKSRRAWNMRCVCSDAMRLWQVNVKGSNLNQHILFVHSRLVPIEACITLKGFNMNSPGCKPRVLRGENTSTPDGVERIVNQKSNHLVLMDPKDVSSRGCHQSGWWQSKKHSKVVYAGRSGNDRRVLQPHSGLINRDPLYPG